MSIFRTVEAECPVCQTPMSFELVYSVSADRRPDLRDAILDGSFQRTVCPSCGAPFRADPEFAYMDIARGQYIGVWPAAMREQWRERAEQTREVFDETLGAGAAPEAREIGEAVQPRAVFGWPALVEKILARQAGIDDRTLEVGKAVLMRTASELRAPGTEEFRLVALQGDDPVFAWVRSDDSRHEAVRAPRKLFAQIDAEPEKWSELRDAVGEGLVVDVQREALEP